MTISQTQTGFDIDCLFPVLAGSEDVSGGAQRSRFCAGDLPEQDASSSSLMLLLGYVILDGSAPCSDWVGNKRTARKQIKKKLKKKTTHRHSYARFRRKPV